MARISALIAGVLFGFGVTLSQMVNPNKVINFMDVLGTWDPSLALVVGGAVAVTLATFPYVTRRVRPVWGDVFQLPTRRDIDRPLILGSVVFGVGWGLAGYCPGAAVGALALSTWEPWIFLPAMLAGSAVARGFQRRRDSLPVKRRASIH
ncbi:MAG: DUF6691 family protein [Pseudomonadota bacterium]|nr:DUF6691 family protein [Pseudomonadota bacterium]